MKNKSRSIALLAATLGIGLGAGYALRAVASGIPSTAALTYSGVLETAGGAFTGSANIQIDFYGAADAGDTIALCEAPSVPVNVTDGHFSVLLPDTCTTQVSGNPNLWVDVFVNGADTGRTKIGAVPYAVEANHSPNADNATNAVNATNASNAIDGGSLASQIAALQAAVTTLQTAPAPVVAIQAVLDSATVDGGSVNGGDVSVNCPTGYTLIASALAQDLRTQSGLYGWTNGGSVGCNISGNTLTTALWNYGGGTTQTSITCYGICVASH